jgi:hypothetical protein
VAAQEVPPDFKKAFTVKCSLKKFCRSAALCAKLNEAALLMDRLVTEVYHLINLDLRVRYELATGPPVEYNWTSETVLMYFYAVSECKGAKYKSHKEVERLIQLRIEHYDDIRNGLPLEKRDKLPVKEAATRIAAAIVTNIRTHFLARQRKYLMLQEDLKKGDAYKRQQEINNQLGIDDSLPAKLKGSVQEHLEKSPHDFLWPMYKMSKVLEEKKKKRFAILPLTTGFVPGACLQLDTQALVKLLGTTDPEVQAYLQANKERLATRPKPKRQ